MNWFRKKESSEEKKVKSEYDDYVAPPPFGSYLAAAPEKPKSLKNEKYNLTEFKGFTPPPKFEFKENSTNNKYDDDFSKYTNSNIIDSSLYDDKPSLFDVNLSHRTRACLESVKMGIKMGTMVGGIFGSLTGLYASFAHKNLFIFPVSVIGGALSFGFFLGCGMIVRC
ncbi:reactive oxygen species modulator 1, putative (ROMO1) [Plasmodium ovale wallikeri]|uniref:Reactive oxygen species modulator 1, putative n=2 Tax=Plasmodium ovale TaxID=36330 RepID=A0A1C3KU12_PLAOA|nr:reactive oxygen species modulator 1, putative (ROMO1) [Plasmodium ovale wallikeri]SBT38270.1 reactive oxygen species modulator 1, putative (ROMO1) [Plasmodium ovale wallikeri]SBT77610.1 reactive oxygen species modulator 1, putative [Plasmodium ovale]